jgi:hypothetical protein
VTFTPFKPSSPGRCEGRRGWEDGMKMENEKRRRGRKGVIYREIKKREKAGNHGVPAHADSRLE